MVQRLPAPFLILALALVQTLAQPLEAVEQLQQQFVIDPMHPNLVTSVPYKDCGSTLASLTYLEVDPPCEAEVCKIPRGQPAILYANMQTRVNISSLRVQVDQIDKTFGFSTRLFPEMRPCGRFNVSCPITENETQFAVVTATFPKSIFPSLWNVKVKVLTEDFEPVLCMTSWVELV